MKREGRLTDAYRWQLTRVLPPPGDEPFSPVRPGDLVKIWKPSKRDIGIVVSVPRLPSNVNSDVITVLWST